MTVSGVRVARGRAKPAAGGPVEGPWALPEGWRWERLGDVLPLSYGKGLTSSERKSSGNVPVYSSAGLIDKHDVALCFEPAIIIGRKGSAGSGYLSKVPSYVIDTAYYCSESNAKMNLRLALRLIEFIDLRKIDQSTAVPSLLRNKYDSLIVPFPREEIQTRLADRIDDLYSDLDDGEAALVRARADLGTWRKALLKAAITGELTAAWRAANSPAETGADLLARILDERRARWISEPRNKGKRYVEPDAPKADDLPPIPDGWAWTTVEAAGDVLLGRQRAPEHHAGEHMRPYLRVANVMEGRLDLRDVKEMNFTPSEFETFALRSGDVLLNEGQSPELLGRPAIYRDEIPGCCFQKTLLRFRPTAAVTPEFALIVFRRYMHGGRFRRESRITTNIGHLTQVRFLPIEFPLPPLQEQREIAARVEAAEAAWDGAVLGADLGGPLRQSILAAAFRGDLVA